MALLRGPNLGDNRDAWEKGDDNRELVFFDERMGECAELKL